MRPPTWLQRDEEQELEVTHLGGLSARAETRRTNTHKVGGAGVKDDLERLRRVADRDDTEVGRIGVLGTVFGCREEDEGLEDAPG